MIIRFVLVLKPSPKGVHPWPQVLKIKILLKVLESRSAVVVEPCQVLEISLSSGIWVEGHKVLFSAVSQRLTTYTIGPDKVLEVDVFLKILEVAPSSAHSDSSQVLKLRILV